MKKKCRKCGKSKDVKNHFGKLKKNKDGLHSYCKTCNKDRCAEWRSRPGNLKRVALNAEAWRQNNSIRYRASVLAYRKRSKMAALIHYSKNSLVCSCCGETEFGFLTIDHVNGGGLKHRRTIKKKGGTSFYNWLRKSGFPNGFQVLCYNCNCSKGALGECPHEIIRRDLGNCHTRGVSMIGGGDNECLSVSLEGSNQGAN